MNASKYRHLISLLLIAFVVTGCSRDMDDLDAYVIETLAKDGGVIEKLPEIKPYDVFVYNADIDDLRSPFVPDLDSSARGSVNNGTSPDRDRSRR